MSDVLGICAVRSGMERKLQQYIERAGFGTRLPSFRVSIGDRPALVRPLFSGMIFAYLGPGFGAIDDLEGVTVRRGAEGRPLCIKGVDAARLDEIEVSCLMGEFNRVRARNVAGRFTSSPALQSNAKPKKRRCRSLTARADRRRKRRAKRRGFRNHTDPTNQVAA